MTFTIFKTDSFDNLFVNYQHSQNSKKKKKKKAASVSKFIIIWVKLTTF